MATKYVSFTGPVRWAKVWENQVDRKFATENAGGNWSVIQTLDGDQVKLYNGLGLKNAAASEMDVQIDKMKKAAKGKESTLEVGDINLRRNEKHPKLGNLGPPVVTGVEAGTPIGNGSICKTTVEVYPYNFEGQPGTAARLVSLDVLDLVEFVKDGGSATSGPDPVVNLDLPPVH